MGWAWRQLAKMGALAGPMGGGQSLLLSDAFPDADSTLLESAASGLWTAQLGAMELNSHKVRGKTTAVDGVELVANGELTTNTIGWGDFRGVSSRVDSSIDPGAISGGADNWCLKFIKNTATSGASVSQPLSTVPGVYHNFSCRAYVPSANTEVNAADFRFIGTANKVVISVEDAWQILALAGKQAVTATDTIYLNALGTTSGDMAYFDAITGQAKYSIYTCNPNRANTDTRVTVTLPGSGIVPFGIVARFSDLSNYWLWRIKPGTAGADFEIVQMKTGARSIKATADIDWSASTAYDLRLTHNNGVFTGYINGTSVLAYTDTTAFNQTETRFGLLEAGTTNALFSGWAVYSI